MTPPPSTGWRRHDGTPAPADADYLVPPDPAIGEIVSADTNRKARGWYPMDSSFRKLVYEVGALGLVLGWLGGVLVLGGHAASVLPWSPGLSLHQKIIALAGAVLAATLGALVTMALRRPRSSYVGRAGVQLRVGGRMKVALFADCAQLKVMRVRHQLNGAYTHTAFKYGFFDPRGRDVLVIKGKSDDRQPERRSDQLRFALAAEQAWNAWKRASAQAAER